MEENKEENKKIQNFEDLAKMFKSDEKEKSKGINEIEISKLTPFKNHPFKLYEGERLSNMIDSIKEMGVILPIIIRPNDNNMFEILSGHNRVTAAKLAGFDKVPAIIKENLDDEEAVLIVTETNLQQRSFTDLSHSERAFCLTQHYEALKQQGKRNDILNEIKMLINADEIDNEETSSEFQTKLRTDEKLGNEYNLSRDKVARYIRISKLIKYFLDKLDENKMNFSAAYLLSYLPKEEQEILQKILEDTNYKIDIKKSEQIKKYSKNGNLTSDKIILILSGQLEKKIKKEKSFKIKPKIINKYFNPQEDKKNIENIIDKALELYFKNSEKEVESGVGSESSSESS